MHRIAAALIAVSLCSLCGCAYYGPYRTAPELCEGTPVDCPKAVLYHHKEPSQTHFDYTLGFVEFNDQGDAWSVTKDPAAARQMDLVMDYLNRQAADHDLLMVVFVHGWHHTAKGQEAGEEHADANVETFQRVLQGLAQEEQQRALNARPARQPRPVVGVYVGWRGDSISIPGLDELTFWDRKNAAAQVGHGGVTQLLSEIELVKRTQDSKARVAARTPTTASPCDALATDPKPVTSDTRLVVVGHSFGGLVVQSAIGQILEDRAVRTKGGDYGCQLGVEGFGNLVVLINPAFEAQRYSVLHDMAEKRRFYPPDQLPVEMILTSQADDATGVLFPLGRHVSTVFDRNGWDAQNVTAVGHYPPYITHTLTRKSPQAPAQANLKQAWVDKSRSDSDVCVAGLTLRRLQLSERNPYLNVSVSGDLIKSHNDIDEPDIINFIQKMMMLSAQTEAERTAPALLDPKCAAVAQ
jgi:hypothetical protein